MTTTPAMKKVELNGADLAAVNGICNSLSVLNCIESQTHLDVKRRRDIDFAAIDRALAAAERLVAAHGPDTPLPGQHGATAAGLLEQVRYVSQLAEPYRRPAKAEARRA